MLVQMKVTREEQSRASARVSCAGIALINQAHLVRPVR